MNALEIDRKRLAKNIQHISAEEVILILNSYGSIKKAETSGTSVGLATEKNILAAIEDFEVEKGGILCGDAIIWKKNSPNVRIMIEIKNYTGVVPKSQIEKFHRDLEENGFSGGIFITNQRVSGQEAVLEGNTIFLQSYDPQIINAACTLLWSVLFDKQYYKFLDYKNNIIPYCNILLEHVQSVVKTKKNLEALHKDFDRCMQASISNVSKTISIINDMTNHIIMEASPLVMTQKLRRFVLPDIANPILPLCRDRLQKLLETLSPEPILLTHTKNKYEYCMGGKKICIHFFTTKIDIIFQPAHFDFSGVDDSFSFSGGLVTVKITAKNAETDVFDCIEKFW
jgi:hypothetical protein